MNKFGDLPGIDIDSQEIYESSDVENENPTDEERQEQAPPDINLEPLQAQFVDIEITDKEYDFSGNLLNQRGFQVGKKKETKMEKLARIKRELEEIQQEEGPECSDADELLSAFNALNASPSQRKFPTEEELKIDEILIPPPEPVHATSQQIAKFVNLENKLNRLETQLGTDHRQSRPLQHSINEIIRKLDIINHAEHNADSIKSKIETTGKEMEKLELNKRLFGWEDVPVPKNEKIDELYNILPDLKTYCTVAPTILERIKGLSGIHNELEESLNFATNLNQLIGDLGQDIREWDKSLNSLNRSLETLKETFEENCSRYETRLDELEKRILRS